MYVYIYIYTHIIYIYTHVSYNYHHTCVCCCFFSAYHTAYLGFGLMWDVHRNLKTLGEKMLEVNYSRAGYCMCFPLHSFFRNPHGKRQHPKHTRRRDCRWIFCCRLWIHHPSSMCYTMRASMFRNSEAASPQKCTKPILIKTHLCMETFTSEPRSCTRLCSAYSAIYLFSSADGHGSSCTKDSLFWTRLNCLNSSPSCQENYQR